jgi:hypothetical protein
MFIITTLLGEGLLAGNENAKVSVPKESAAVDPRARCPATPSGVFINTELSDVQSVASDSEPPVRKQLVASPEPTLDPSTVTLIAPVAATLATDALLTSAPIKVNAPDIVPLARTAVTPTARTLPTPPPTLLSKELSDVQTEASERVAQKRGAELTAVSPRLEARSVTLIAPVAAVLEADTLLGAGLWKVNTSDTLSTANPLVSALRRAHTVPEAVLHATALSEVQAVISDAVSPNRERPLCSASPALLPSKVTLIAAVVAPFEANKLLGPGPPNVNTSDKLPTPCPPLSTTRLACHIPSPALHASADSDIQTIFSEELPPTRPHSSL